MTKFGENSCRISPFLLIFDTHFFKKIDQLVKTFQMMYNVTSFGMINTLVYGGWGSNFNTCPNMVNEVKKMPNAFLTFLNFCTTKNNQNTASDNLCTRNCNIEYSEGNNRRGGNNRGGGLDIVIIINNRGGGRG